MQKCKLAAQLINKDRLRDDVWNCAGGRPCAQESCASYLPVSQVVMSDAKMHPLSPTELAVTKPACVQAGLRPIPGIRRSHQQVN